MPKRLCALLRMPNRKHENPHAAALGRLGGLAAAGKGVRKYMASLTPAQRRAKARKAIRARWAKATKADRQRQHRIMLAARRAKRRSEKPGQKERTQR
jgi:hypothetical protein